jgi:hypothetical protein
MCLSTVSAGTALVQDEEGLRFDVDGGPLVEFEISFHFLSIE